MTGIRQSSGNGQGSQNLPRGIQVGIGDEESPIEKAGQTPGIG